MIARFCHVSFVVALAFAWLGSPRGAEAPKQELEALRELLEKLQRDTAETESDRSEVSDQLRKSERAISAATKALRDVQAEQRQARDALRAIEEQTRKQNAAVGDRSRDLGRVLYARYVHGEQDFLRLLLSGRDPQGIARDLHYYSYISRANAVLIQGLRSNVEELGRLTEQGREKSAELSRLEKQSRDEWSKLERERSEWQKVLANLSGQLQRQRREIQTLRANEQRLTQLVERLARALRERPRPVPAPRAPDRNDKVPEATEMRGVFSSLRGRLRLPVRGEIVSKFGSARADGGPTWKGVFIQATESEEVRAVAPGRVVYAEWMRGFGNLLIVDHGEEYLTIYGNNEALLRRTGDTVRSGDAIATVGRTGGNEAPGLYFELRHQGRPIDPLGWVAQR